MVDNLRLISERRLVRSEGLEPPTPSFEGWCSIQLSYERATAHYGTQGSRLGTQALTWHLRHSRHPWHFVSYEQLFPLRSPRTHCASICHSGSERDCQRRGPLWV